MRDSKLWWCAGLIILLLWKSLLRWCSPLHPIVNVLILTLSMAYVYSSFTVFYCFIGCTRNYWQNVSLLANSKWKSDLMSLKNDKSFILQIKPSYHWLENYGKVGNTLHSGSPLQPAAWPSVSHFIYLSFSFLLCQRRELDSAFPRACVVETSSVGCYWIVKAKVGIHYQTIQRKAVKTEDILCVIVQRYGKLFTHLFNKHLLKNFCARCWVCYSWYLVASKDGKKNWPSKSLYSYGVW